MSNRSIIPFGPQHPVLPEPIHLDLVLEDEKVVEAIPTIGFVHRGLEKLVEKRIFKSMFSLQKEFVVYVALYMEWDIVKLLKRLWILKFQKEQNI